MFSITKQCTVTHGKVFFFYLHTNYILKTYRDPPNILAATHFSVTTHSLETSCTDRCKVDYQVFKKNHYRKY